MDADGRTLHRFDNAPYYADGVATTDTPAGEIESLEDTGLRALAEQFLQEVTERHEQRTD